MPDWSVVLRALREAAGITQDGWAAWLGVGRATVQRWESGDTVPNRAAETAIVDLCRARGLFRTFSSGPLGGLTITADLLRDLLADGRAGMIRAGAGVGALFLPAPPTSFVGREAELVEIRRLLDDTRLLTLTGAGGIGKSRLAVRIAEQLRSRFPGGVRLVELAALPARGMGPPGTIEEHRLVLQAVAQVFAVREESGRPLLDSVAAAVPEAPSLLILDNCEHVVAACEDLAATLLKSCPSLILLATSREALGVAGETAWRVPPMSLPMAGPHPPAPSPSIGRGGDHLPSSNAGGGAGGEGRLNRDDGRRTGGSSGRPAESDAVRLFVERARAVRYGFTLTPENAAAVVEICRRLDGIPLAIELAAARVGVLSVEQIAVRLDDRFRLLTAGSREALPRQQTLRAALDWSYDLLTEQERAVLRRLSVFAGGCSLEAAEAVCSGDGIPPDEVLDLLAKLADKSLLIVDEQGGEARYHLLETVRQYAAGRLGGDASEAECARRAHRDWYLALAERAAPLLRGAEQAVWLDWLEREHANLHAALEWSLTAPGEAATALRLAATLREFWHMRGHPGEGRRWLEAALAVEGDVPPGVRAAGLDGAGILAHSQGDYAAARAFHEESLGLWRRLNDRRGLAVCLNARGIVAMALHDFEGAERSLEESLACWRELGEDGRVAILLNNLGYMAVQRGDYERAETLYQESLEIKRRLHDVTGVAVALNNLGEAARYRGDYTRATALMGESLSLFRELGSAPRVAQVLHSLAMTAQEQGDDRRAGAHLVEGIGIFRQLDDRLGMIQCLEGLAAVAARTGAPARAARLFGAAEAARERIGSPLPLPDRAAHDRAVKTARAALDPTAFAAAWLVGRSLPLAQAADEAAAGRSL